MMRTLHWPAMIVIGLLASSCGFFDGDDSEFGDDSDESGDQTEEGGDPPPTQGFRVFPKFMLQDLSAIVTIDIDGITVSPCELDGALEGGYVCDAGPFSADSAVTIAVEKDGFASAVRHPIVVFNQIVALEVHLAVDGGPIGSWSPCTVVGDFESCADLCSTLQGTCAVTSCATDQPEWPIATYETFADAECTTLIDSEALACESPLPLTGPAALRCCCAG